MLSEKAISLLADLTYREDAVREINLIPLSGIYWEDEFPMFGDTAEILSEQDRREIMSLFCIRVALWRGHTPMEYEQKRWDDALESDSKPRIQ